MQDTHLQRDLLVATGVFGYAVMYLDLFILKAEELNREL
jgi:hypothetical protein